MVVFLLADNISHLISGEESSHEKQPKESKKTGKTWT
jgi:hypothetical protein